MRIALAQYRLGLEMKENLTKALHLMEVAAKQHAQLICFPELSLSPFFPQFSGQDASRYAIFIEDDHLKQLQSTCKRLDLTAAPNVYLEEKSQRFDASWPVPSTAPKNPPEHCARKGGSCAGAQKHSFARKNWSQLRTTGMGESDV